MRRLAVFCVAVLVVGCGKTASDDRAAEKTPSTTNAPAPVQPVSPQSSNQAEAQYKGKGISVWARQLHDKDVPTRIEAAKALQALRLQAKAAVPDLQTALKERAWELLLMHGGRNANRTFTSVANTIGRLPPRAPTKDEIIAELRRELDQKQREIAALHKQEEKLATDPCMQALATALLAIDQRELEAMLPAPVVQATKTFTQVSEKIGTPGK